VDDPFSSVRWRVRCVDSKGMRRGGIITPDRSIASCQYNNLVSLATDGHHDWRIVLEVRGEDNCCEYRTVKSYP